MIDSMKGFMNCILIGLMLVVSSVSAFSMNTGSVNTKAWHLPHPDTKVQAELNNIAKWLTVQDKNNVSPSQREKKLKIKVKQLQEHIHNNTIFAQQLVYYMLHASSERQWSNALAIIKASPLKDESGSLAEALPPFLMAKNGYIRKLVSGILRENVESRCPISSRSLGRTSECANYSEYIGLLKLHGVDQPTSKALIQHMFEGSPANALMALADVANVSGQQLKPLLWAQHVIDDTIWKHQYGFLPKKTVEPEAEKQLAMMSAQPQWWARLYAAEIMKQHPAFRKDSLTEKLKSDKNAMVRKTIAEFAGNGK